MVWIWTGFQEHVCWMLDLQLLILFWEVLATLESRVFLKEVSHWEMCLVKLCLVPSSVWFLLAMTYTISSSTHFLALMFCFTKRPTSMEHTDKWPRTKTSVNLSPNKPPTLLGCFYLVFGHSKNISNTATLGDTIGDLLIYYALPSKASQDSTLAKHSCAQKSLGQHLLAQSCPKTLNIIFLGIIKARGTGVLLRPKQVSLVQQVPHYHFRAKLMVALCITMRTNADMQNWASVWGSSLL